MAAPGRSHFVCWYITRVSLWLLCISCKVRKVALLWDFADLKAQIIAALKNLKAPMLARVWQEIEYRIAVSRVTRGPHIEHL